MVIQRGGDDVTSKEAKMYIFPAAGWLTADALFVADFDRISSMSFVQCM